MNRDMAFSRWQTNLVMTHCYSKHVQSNPFYLACETSTYLVLLPSSFFSLSSCSCPIPTPQHTLGNPHSILIRFSLLLQPIMSSSLGHWIHCFLSWYTFSSICWPNLYSVSVSHLICHFFWEIFFNLPGWSRYSSMSSHHSQCFITSCSPSTSAMVSSFIYILDQTISSLSAETRPHLLSEHCRTEGIQHALDYI